VTSKHRLRSYVHHCQACFEERGHSSVLLRAMGRAIAKAVVIGAPPALRAV
jgi:DNA-binding protein